MRVLIAGFQHETNTFAPSKATFADFERGGMFPSIAYGSDILSLRDTNIPVGGFIREAEELSYDLVPTIWAGATPSAHVTEDAFERIVGRIVDDVRRHEVNGIYLDLHGAMVCEHVDDGEGELLRRLREIVGWSVPIVASLDLHGNVTRMMLEQASMLTAYRTYPHEDMAATGARAAHLLQGCLGSGDLHTYSRRLPFLIPINAMFTGSDPAKACYTRLEELEAKHGLALSFAPGFPAADFSECGGTVWGHGSDAAVVESAVEDLYQAVVRREAEWSVPFLAPVEAVREAMKITRDGRKVVVIADTQDNPGAGGDSNTTGMLRALIDCDAPQAAIGLIVDPAAAAAAHAAGLGKEISIPLGGQSGIPGDGPLSGTFRVEQLSDGECVFAGRMLTGKKAGVGPSARLSIGGVQIVVCTYKDQLIDREFFRMVGITPEDMRILVLKSSVHFRADFEQIADAILVAKAPGPMLADPADFAWKKLDGSIRRSPATSALS